MSLIAGVKFMSKMENNSSSNIQELITSNHKLILNQQLSLSSKQTSDPIPLIQSPSSSAYDHEQPRTLPISERLLDSPSPFSATPLAQKNKSLVRNKSKRYNNRLEAEEKPKEVIHVRAKRGQATDSHSLAERVRRKKINEKLRYLQDLVPGCSQAMGMAVMLDVIIDYVQSLQHQIEFLSMKLTAASLHLETFQRNPDSCEVQEMGKIGEEGFGGYSYFSPTWPLH